MQECPPSPVNCPAGAVTRPHCSPRHRRCNVSRSRLVVCLLTVLVAATVVAQQDPDESGPRLKVPAADTHLFFTTQPVVVEGSVFVPLAAIERWLNTRVQGDPRGEFSISYYGETPTAVSLKMWVGQKRAMVAQAEVPLDHPPQVIGEETFVPLKFIAEAVGVWVEPYDHMLRLRKPDEGWICYLALPPHPKSLEGKMLALALARRPGTPKRVEQLGLSADTMSGYASIAEPADNEAGILRYTVRYTRDRTGWHFASEGPGLPLPEPPGD